MKKSVFLSLALILAPVVFSGTAWAAPGNPENDACYEAAPLTPWGAVTSSRTGFPNCATTPPNGYSCEHWRTLYIDVNLYCSGILREQSLPSSDACRTVLDNQYCALECQYDYCYEAGPVNGATCYCRSTVNNQFCSTHYGSGCATTCSSGNCNSHPVNGSTCYCPITNQYCVSQFGSGCQATPPSVPHNSHSVSGGGTCYCPKTADEQCREHKSTCRDSALGCQFGAIGCHEETTSNNVTCLCRGSNSNNNQSQQGQQQNQAQGNEPPEQTPDEICQSTHSNQYCSATSCDAVGFHPAGYTCKTYNDKGLSCYCWEEEDTPPVYPTKPQCQEAFNNEYCAPDSSICSIATTYEGACEEYPLYDGTCYCINKEAWTDEKCRSVFGSNCVLGTSCSKTPGMSPESGYTCQTHSGHGYSCSCWEQEHTPVYPTDEQCVATYGDSCFNEEYKIPSGYAYVTHALYDGTCYCATSSDPGAQENTVHSCPSGMHTDVDNCCCVFND